MQLSHLPGLEGVLFGNSRDLFLYILALMGEKYCQVMA